MPTGKTAWGIDMGHSALKALKLRAAGDKVEVLAFDFIEHAKMLSQPDADRRALIADALEKLSSRHDLANERLVVAVPGQHTLSRFTKLPPVEAKKIPDIVRYEAEQQIPFDMDEVVWDYQTFASEGSPEVEVGIFAMKRELVHQFLAQYAGLQMETAAVQAGPLALYNALAFDGRCGDRATVILDIGAQNTDLIVAAGPGLWARTINIGGNQFTEALVKSFKLSFPKAEALKRTAASSKYARQIFQAMRPVFADLVAEVQRSIGFYSSSHRDVKLTKALGVGNAFKMPGLQKFLQQSLGMEVVRLGEFQNLSPPLEGNTSDFTDNLLSFGVAYGLGLQGLGLARIESSLLPPEIARRVVWQKKHTWFAGAAACLLLAAGTIWMRYLVDKGALDNAGDSLSPPSMDYEQAKTVFARPVDKNQRPRDFAYEVLAVAETFKHEYAGRARERQDCEEDIDKYLELQEGKTLWLQILGEIYNALPVEPALSRVKGPEEYKQAIAENPRALSREERKEVFLESFRSMYSPDVYETLESMGEVARPGRDFRGEPRKAKQPKGRGFVIELKLRTPNKAGATFVEQTFNAHLMRQDWPEEYDFYFDRVRIVEVAQLGQVTKPVPTVAGYRRPGAATGAEAPAAQLTDPVTGESTVKDWLCTIHMAAVQGRRPQAAEAKAAEDTEARARAGRGA